MAKDRSQVNELITIQCRYVILSHELKMVSVPSCLVEVHLRVLLVYNNHHLCSYAFFNSLKG